MTRFCNLFWVYVLFKQKKQQQNTPVVAGKPAGTRQEPSFENLSVCFSAARGRERYRCLAEVFRRESVVGIATNSQASGFVFMFFPALLRQAVQPNMTNATLLD